jgi:hypothetical protein
LVQELGHHASHDAAAILGRSHVDLGTLRRITTLLDPKEDDPRTVCVDDLRRGGLTRPRPDTFAARVGRGVLRVGTRRFAEATPMIFILEQEAVRQAVRLGHHMVTTAHLLLAALTVDDQLALSGLSLAPELVDGNRGGSMLVGAGVTHDVLTRHLAGRTVNKQPASYRRRRQWRTRAGFPQWTVEAESAADRVRRCGEPGSVGTTHLVDEALRDHEGDAYMTLMALGVDLATMRA